MRHHAQLLQVMHPSPPCPSLEPLFLVDFVVVDNFWELSGRWLWKPQMLFREPTKLYGTFFGSEFIPEPGKKATVLPPYTVGSAQLHIDTHVSRGSDIGFEILVETMAFVKNSDSLLTRSEVSHPKAWRKIVHQDTRGHAISCHSWGHTLPLPARVAQRTMLEHGLLTESSSVDSQALVALLPPAETPGWSPLPLQDKLWWHWDSDVFLNRDISFEVWQRHTVWCVLVLS